MKRASGIDKRPNGRWRARAYAPDGTRRTATFDTAKEAAKWKRDLESSKDRGAFVDPRAGAATLGEVAATVFEHKQRRLRPSAYQRDESYFRNHILPAFGTTRIGSIRRSDVQVWVSELEKKGLAPRTVRDIYGILRSIFVEAVEERTVPESPCRRIALPRVPDPDRKFLDHDGVARLAHAIDDRYETLILTTAYMGLRWGEVAGLKRQHVDLLRKQMSIQGSLERVGGTFRYVAELKNVQSRRMLDMGTPLVERLALHLQHTVDSEFVFPAPEGGFLSYHNFRKRFWGPATVAAGLEGLGFHELRHTCVSLLIDQRADILNVSRYLGHKDIKTTLQLYGHLFPARGKEFAEKLGEAMVAAESARSETTVLPITGEAV
jgi:integrase